MKQSMFGVLTRTNVTNHDAVFGINGSQHVDKQTATDESISEKALQKKACLVVGKLDILRVDTTLNVVEIVTRKIIESQKNTKDSKLEEDVYPTRG